MNKIIKRLTDSEEVAVFTEHLDAAIGQDYHLRTFLDMLSKNGKA
jgi:hypothetical protein